MNVGKTLFAQVMEYVPWKTFRRIIERHNGDAGVRTRTVPICSRNGFRTIDVARVLARHRDLSDSQSGQAFPHGIEGHTCALDVVGCIERARLTHLSRTGNVTDCASRDSTPKEPLGMDLDATVYALDATNIDLCLSLFDWASSQSTKAAVKMHALLDLRGAIPAFIHISDGKIHEVNVLDFLPVEAGAFCALQPDTNNTISSPMNNQLIPSDF